MAASTADASATTSSEPPGQPASHSVETIGEVVVPMGRSMDRLSQIRQPMSVDRRFCLAAASDRPESEAQTASGRYDERHSPLGTSRGAESVCRCGWPARARIPGRDRRQVEFLEER
jgi:hypothetical protein